MANGDRIVTPMIILQYAGLPPSRLERNSTVGFAEVSCHVV